jgi:hypothetical protein
VLPADIKELIARLDPGSFNAFVGGLLAAETERLSLPATSLVMSDAIDESDGGLDALIKDVAASDLQPPSSFPQGEIGLQLKSQRRKAPNAFGLAGELRKPGPKRVLATGGTYILISSQDLNAAQREALEQALASEAAKVVAETGDSSWPPKTMLWDATTLALMSRTHPAPVAEIGIADFGHALTLPELMQSLHAHERPFQSDQPRDVAVDRLRARAGEQSEDPLLMTVHGAPGVGKTRAVAHALNTDELRDLVLYVNGAEGLQVLLTRLIRLPVSRGTLFVDEVDEHAVIDACKRLGGLAGRWRVVSVTSQTDRRWISEGARNIVLPPLSHEATRRMVEQHPGLPGALAGMVAEVAAGFPELAFSLADELRADPSLDLVRLARLPQPQHVLKRALSDEDLRLHLAPIAMFSGVGFDGELRYEIEAVARAFELDASQMKRYCEAELGRFASKAGRYRMISPLLVAIWLATDLIERTPDFENRVIGLPESLQDAFVQQLEHFGPGAPHLPDALRRVIMDNRFRRPKDFSEAAARFLRAAAAIIPSQVANAIDNLLQVASQDDLRQIPRRDLVWTLRVLLWWPGTWEIAVNRLYLLALHENETWANNATGEFTSAFTLYLSGSTVPYADRADWLARTIEVSHGEALPLLGEAAAAGLQTFHSRARVGFEGGGEPKDWEPRTLEEYVGARRTAWHLLLEIRDMAAPDARLTYTRKLASALRLAYESRLRSEIADAIRSREWFPQERAALASGLRDVIRYEETDEDIRAEIQDLHDALMGDGLSNRLQVVLGTSLWDLHSDSETIHDVPPLLREIADELVESGGEGLQRALETGRDLPEQETRYALIRLLAAHMSAQSVGDAARAKQDWLALGAALSVADAAGDGEWATSVLSDLSASAPGRVPELLSVVDVTDERLDLALSLVETGRSSVSGLARFLFGSRIRGLDAERTARVLEVLASSDNVEAALGMLNQWLDENSVPSSRIRAVAAKLALMAAVDEAHTMTEFYLKQLVETEVLEPAIIAELWEKRMLNRSGPIGELDVLLTDQIIRDPETAAPIVYRLVKRRSVSLGLFSGQHLGLLSRLTEVASLDTVWGELHRWSKDDLRWALHHMTWNGPQPHPLVRAFLTSDRLNGLEVEAVTCFSDTLGIVSGPYYLALERELDRAVAWRESLRNTTAEEWASKLVKRYERDIESDRLWEEEQDLRLR